MFKMMFGTYEKKLYYSISLLAAFGAGWYTVEETEKAIVYGCIVLVSGCGYLMQFRKEG